MSKMPTFTGKVFDYLHPLPDMICIEDIANGLAKDCRYTGQCNGFYSVAQHSLIGAMLIDLPFAVEFMLHDASEAYCRDIPSPLKRLLPEYQEIEARVDRIIRFKFDLPDRESPEVKAMDDALYYTERRDITPDYQREHWDDQQYKVGTAILDYKIIPMEWREARDRYISFFHALTGGVWR